MSENSGGSRPFVDFNEVKRRVPLPDVLDVLGIRGRFREQNGVLTGVCPFPDHQHGPQPNPDQFKMNVVDGVWLWRCWGDCQATGNVIQFVMRMEGLTEIRDSGVEAFPDAGHGERERNRILIRA